MNEERERRGRDDARRALPRDGDTSPRGVRLPCGRDPDDLVDQVAESAGEDLDGHQSTCPHCRAALGEYRRLWRGVEAVATHEPDPPEAAIDEVLRRLRGAVAERDYALLDEPDGRTRVASRAVAVAAQRIGGTVPGVRVALGRVVDRAADAEARPRPAVPRSSARVVATVSVVGGSTAIEITLAAQAGTDLPALGRQVRDAVTHGVRDLLGLEPVVVDVVIDDVLP